MDSVNSGSLQSGCEGDEFNSNSGDHSLSAIFHACATIPTTAGAALPLPQPPPPPSCSVDHFFDPISYLDSITSLNGVDFPSFTTLSSSSPDGINANSPSPVQPPDQPVAAATAPRSSKKRSRASRRAQTTVLNTDTSNFRAMVQQFTGIPSPPFDIAAAASTSSYPFARSRFNLFRSATAAFGSSSVPPQPPFLLRPFPLKVQGSTSTTTTTSITAPNIYSSSSTSSSFDTSTSIAATNSIFNANLNSSVQISTTRCSTNPNHLPSPDLGLGSQSQPLVNTQRPMLSLQSLLQSKCSTPPNMPDFFSTKPQITTPSTELGSDNPGFPAPELMVPDDGMQSSWAYGSRPDVGDHAQSRPISAGNFSDSQQGVSSCKLNYLAPGSSEFNAEKGPECAVRGSRGDGMMDSWIFSSD